LRQNRIKLRHSASKKIRLMMDKPLTAAWLCHAASPASKPTYLVGRRGGVTTAFFHLF